MKYSEIKKLASSLRKNQTPSEKILWKYLRKRRLKGRKFLRQHPIIYESNKSEHFFYIPDFYCAKEKLVIEVDGKIHDFQKEKDEHRDLILKDKGVKILRIKNEELENIENVIRKIIECFS